MTVPATGIPNIREPSAGYQKCFVLAVNAPSMNTDKQPVHRLNVPFSAERCAPFLEWLYAKKSKTTGAFKLIGSQEYQGIVDFLKAAPIKGSKDQTGPDKWRYKLQSQTGKLLSVGSTGAGAAVQGGAGDRQATQSVCEAVAAS